MIVFIIMLGLFLCTAQIWGKGSGPFTLRGKEEVKGKEE